MYSVLFKEEQAHDDGIWSVAWVKGKVDEMNHIVTGSIDDTVKAWQWFGLLKKLNFLVCFLIRNEERLNLRYIFEGHALGVVSVDINSEGTIAASSSLDSHIRFWDLNSGTQVQSIDAGPVDAWTVCFSPDSKLIATGSYSGKINLYNTETGTREAQLDTKGKFPLTIAFVNGKSVASGATDGMIKIFDVESGKLVKTLEGHAMPIRSLAFSPDCQFLVTASDDCHLKVYDVQNADPLRTLSGHGSWVLSVSFSPNNNNFASSSSDKTVKIWEVRSNECVHTFSEHTDQVWCCKYNHNGSRLVSVSDDHSILIYECPI
ncbi:WD repeat-containing protein 61-like protein [Dinothrombium tinctorium]|uniref:WD repeat-containing protein 61-like protein n=1 Tax=Dinothrombium tinctorium TaxID=1965070 RepID=A0A3S3QAI8_9ACAR|nr:WD repeat-containing protein 61-like protein [Dinothrombium tinctorium]